MNVVRCKKGHFFDRDEHIRCPHCGEIVESGEVRKIPKKNILRERKFRIYLPGYNVKEPVYGCVLHHPERSAWIRPFDKTLESTLTTGFGVSVSDREIGRYLSSVIQQLCASGDYIRCLGKYMKQTAENASLPTGLAEAFKF